MSSATLLMIFLMGLAGSLHCAGMCGPIVWVMPFQQYRGARKFAALALYHVGRISSYAFLAIMLHSFTSIFDPKIQQYISILLGAALLLVGVFSFMPGTYLKMKLPWAEYVKRLLGRFISREGIGKFVVTGALNGLLPCGLVYMALSGSLVAGTPVQAAMMMYVFGLGTLPMLISITMLKSKMTFLRAPNIRKAVPVVMFIFGCIFVLRGLNLGIPYLSPKVTITQHGIKACCCHK